MFVLKEDGGLVPLKQEEFACEADFQKLLEDFPALLAGDLIDPEEPRRWLLVTREIGVPGETGGNTVWSADHLFLDQDGIPTIVEVKRTSDTRLRREVVAQMLDYAANGVAFWTADSLRTKYESTCQSKGKDPEVELQEFLGAEVESGKFWNQVKTNLEAQKVRLLFVADVIPRELRRIVEFLNRQMNPVEVLALELKHYVGENRLRTLAPTLFGQTEESRVSKQTNPARNWDSTSFFQELATRGPADTVETAKEILGWMQKNGDSVVYGHGKVDGSITSYIRVNGLKLYPMTLTTQGKVWINFRDCMKPPFDDEARRREWFSKLNSIKGIKLSEDKISKYALIPLSVLSNREERTEFLSTMDWFKSELKAYPSTG